MLFRTGNPGSSAEAWLKRVSRPTSGLKSFGQFQSRGSLIALRSLFEFSSIVELISSSQQSSIIPRCLAAKRHFVWHRLLDFSASVLFDNPHLCITATFQSSWVFIASLWDFTVILIFVGLCREQPNSFAACVTASCHRIVQAVSLQLFYSKGWVIRSFTARILIWFVGIRFEFIWLRICHGVYFCTAGCLAPRISILPFAFQFASVRLSLSLRHFLIWCTERVYRVRCLDRSNCIESDR